MSLRVRVSIVIGERCNSGANRDKVVTLSLIDVDQIFRALGKIYSRLFSRFDRNSKNGVCTTLVETFRNLPRCRW